MKKTITALMIIGGMLQGTATFAVVCDEKAFENECFPGRKQCYTQCAPKKGLEFDACMKPCDTAFQKCGVDRGCLNVAMQEIKKQKLNHR